MQYFIIIRAVNLCQCTVVRCYNIGRSSTLVDHAYLSKVILRYKGPYLHLLMLFVVELVSDGDYAFSLSDEVNIVVLGFIFFVISLLMVVDVIIVVFMIFLDYLLLLIAQDFLRPFQYSLHPFNNVSQNILIIYLTVFC